MNKGKNIAWILVLTLLLGGCTITQNTTEQDTQSVQDTSQTEILTEQVQTETVEEMQEFVNLLQAQAKTRNDTAKPFMREIHARK